MTILKKPYKREDYVKLVLECNKAGNKRIEIHQGDAYALFEYERVENGKIVDLRETEEYKKEQSEKIKNERIQKWTTILSEKLECHPDDISIFAGTFIDEEDEDDHLWTYVDQEGWDEIRICIQPLRIWWKNDPTVN